MLSSVHFIPMESEVWQSSSGYKTLLRELGQKRACYESLEQSQNSFCVCVAQKLSLNLTQNTENLAKPGWWTPRTG